MPKMLEMIQQSAVPANIMRTASRGALALPAGEMLEILVYLTTHPLFGEEAKMSLAQWDEASARAICADPSTSHTVLEYFLNPRNWRLPVLAAILENPSIDEHHLMDLSAAASREVAGVMVASKRVQSFKWVLKQLVANSRIAGSAEHAKAQELLTSPPAAAQMAATQPAEEAAQVPAPAMPNPDDLVDEDEIIEFFHQTHAEEIAAEEGKKFEIVKSEEPDEEDELADLVKIAEAKAADDKAAAELEAAAAAAKKHIEPERISTIQKIARLSVGDRVQLAVKGSKDDRFILIRDGSKIVSLAVLESPKLTDSEMETFASMKNIQQSVLRAMAGKRKFLKMYSVQRALCSNPRLPLDCSLKLLPNLLVSDLQNLSKNKNVSDTLRKLALKLYKDRSSTRR